MEGACCKVLPGEAVKGEFVQTWLLLRAFNVGIGSVRIMLTILGQLSDFRLALQVSPYSIRQPLMYEVTTVKTWRLTEQTMPRTRG